MKIKAKYMKTHYKNKTGNENNAQSELAAINDQIEALQGQRIALADPMKSRWAELRGELVEMEAQIRELDPSWKPASLRPKVDDKIMEILTTKGQPMAIEEIIQTVGGLFTPWKVKNILKKKSTGAKAVFVVNDGKYAIKG
jgi:hypothetical protein